ncbi:hypothetical protein ED733_000622 [Metarhizium rileyi]|uniref:non-specific serine/threonine protein kinase n=1 Tax=Metarhizium rileyi (strain RCEF 4871) TaxID=1649241 RepID=A0A5C6G6L0_METRR|nr:hypothetical protein ED733_000622 [Metarhizium rileyi]
MALTHPPWPSSTAIAPRLDSSLLVEEEKTPYYHVSRFYPVRLGQVFHGRYQIATKLGYGSSSTVWLARDLYSWRWSRERYVALKINALNHRSDQNTAENELAILEHISSANKKHEGWHFVRRLLGSFRIEGVAGTHLCLVLEPLREPLWLYCQRFVGGTIPSNILKIIMRMILQGLDYLHSECQIIHTDLKPDNILVKLEDLAMLDRDARDEYHTPLPQKITDDRTIYLSRNDYGQFSKPTGLVQITDFGLSVSGKTQHSGCIQAEIYRAPEVILDAGYSYSADIWSLGIMMWDLLEGKTLLDPIHRQTSDEYDDLMHLAQLTSLLGPPPSNILHSGRRTAMFHKPDGDLKHPELVPKDLKFENTVTRISGQDKTDFLEFVKKMVKWNPAERSTARDLLKDPWLYGDYPSDAQ